MKDSSEIKIIPVLLAGGKGTRLWPAVGEGLPKPLLSLPDGKSLLDHAMEAARALSPKGPLLVATDDAVAETIMAAAGTNAYLLKEKAPVGTAALIASACAWVERYVPGAIAWILPCDHVMDTQALADIAPMAAAHAAQGKMTLIGIPPHSADTGYGYLETRLVHDLTLGISRFVEKPSREEAEELCGRSDVFWNSGMFVLPPKQALQWVATYASDIHCDWAHAWPKEAEPVDVVLSDVSETISWDYAVVEHLPPEALAAIPFSGNWADVGTWERLDAWARREGYACANDNVMLGEAEAHHVTGSLIVPGEYVLPPLPQLQDVVAVGSAEGWHIAQKSQLEEGGDVKRLFSLKK